jgi:hypothetical protein
LAAVPDHLSPHDRPVFMLSLGRSGSTFVQRVLNAHPGLTMWGEHNGVITPLARSVQRIAHDPRNRPYLNDGYDQRHKLIGPLADPSTFIAWVGPFNSHSYVDAMRGFVRDLFAAEVPPSVRWGFKEIRYGREEAEFLGTLFPQARFIVLARRPAGQIRSRVRAWTKPGDYGDDLDPSALGERIGSFVDEWVGRYRQLTDFADAPATTARLVGYEPFVADRSRVDALFTFLDEQPPSAEAIERVFDRHADITDNFDNWSATQLERIDEVIAQQLAARPEVADLEARFGLG